MPQLSQIHIDTALTNISVMYRNENYIAERVLPIMPVQKRSDKYFVYGKTDFASPSPSDAQSPARPTSLRRPNAEAAEIDFSLSTQNYYAEEFAYRNLVTDAEVRYADNPLQPDIDATIQVTERLLLDNESVTALKVGTAANYNSSNTKALVSGAGTNPGDSSWAQYTQANSLPLTNIVNAKKQVLSQIIRLPNTLVMGTDAALVLADHPTIKDLVKYTHPEALTSSGLPNVIRGLQVIEGAQQKNTAAEGAAYSGGYLWDASDGTAMCLIYYRTDQPQLRDVAFGKTFEAPDDTTGVRGISVRRYRDEKRKGTIIEASFLRDFQFIAQDGSSKAIGGYLFTSVTA